METSMEPEPVPPPSSIPSTPEIPPSLSPNPDPTPQTPNLLPISISTPDQQHQQSQSQPNPQPQPQPQQQQQQQQQLQHQQQQQLQQQQQQQLQQQQQQPAFQQSQQRSNLPQPNKNRQQTPYPHFSQHLPSSSSSSPISATPMQRGGLAIGVPAHHSRPQQPTSILQGGHPSFGSSFNHHLQQQQQQLGVLPRNSMIGQSQVPANVPEQLSNSNTQARQPVQGIQTLGMIGSLSSGTQIRPSGVTGHHNQMAGQLPSRSQSPSNNQALASQKLQGHGLLRSPLGSVSSPSPGTPGTPQGSQPHSQPWLPPQGKQMHTSSLPSPSYRQHARPQGLPHRPQHPQQHQHPLSAGPHQQQTLSAQQQHQQPSQSHHPQEQYGQQYPPPRIPQSAPHQLQASRAPGSANQKALASTTSQPSIQSGAVITTGSIIPGESSNQILSKRSIRELVAQVDPSERLNPEVEDILVEIADDFVESITTFACSLAKHRKSTTLEAKDILLHLERNWNMTLPGFGGDEIKSYKKPFANDIHKERLAAVKKSVIIAQAGTDFGNAKSSAGQAAGNVKSHPPKAPAVSSPKITRIALSAGLARLCGEKDAADEACS